MIETDGIFAEFHNYSLGQPLRIEVVASESSATKARALSVLRQKVLNVVVFSGANEKEFCRFTATLPHKADGELIQRCIVPYGNKQVKLMLDIAPASHKTLLLMIEEFYGQPQKMRLEFYAESDLAVKAKREPKPPKGDHGKFWQELRAFHNRPDVRHWLAVEVGYAEEQTAIQRLYELFNVSSRTFISPDALRDWVAKMPDCDGALTVIENAKAKTW